MNPHGTRHQQLRMRTARGHAGSIFAWPGAGPVLARCWAGANQMLDHCWSNVGQVLVRCWSEVGQVLVRIIRF